MSEKNKGNLILLLTAILWGTGFISQKLGNRAMPPMTFNAIRQFMAALVLTPVAMRGLRTSGYLSLKHSSQTQIDHRKKKLLKAGLLCGLFMLIGTATQQIGLLTVSAGKSGFISSIYIVFTPLFSVIVGSKVKRRSVICIAIAMIGFAIMSLKGGPGGATPGDWLTLVSAAGFAAQIVTVNCFVDKDNAILISQAQFLPALFNVLVQFHLSTRKLSAETRLSKSHPTEGHSLKAIRRKIVHRKVISFHAGTARRRSSRTQLQGS